MIISLNLRQNHRPKEQFSDEQNQNMFEVKYSVDNNLMDWDELLRWYDYTLDAHELGLSIPNFRAWHKGCPRISDEKINELKSMRKELLNAIEEAKDSF